jgi:HK97 family phage major capsid protein
VIAIEQAPALGTQGDIVLADLSQYMTITGAPRYALSADAGFLTDESLIRFTLRCDGNPMWSSPITPYNGTLTRSPFITLAAR